MSAPLRILAVRLSAVGDVINTLPALDALRRSFPDAFIGFAVEDRAQDLILNHPSVNRVHLFPRKRWKRMMRRPWQWPGLMGEVSAFARELRAEHYDVALNYQSNFKGAMHGVLSRARRRVGFGRGHSRELSHWLANELVTPPNDGIVNRVEKFLSMSAAIGASTADARYVIPRSGESEERVESFLRSAGLSSFAVIHPGTSDFGKLKRWAPARFGELAAEVWRKQGLVSIVTWGPNERPLAEEVVAASEGHGRLGPETKSLLDLAVLIRRARIFVGADTGPLHLASAVGTPSVALFGPKDPRIYAPWNPRKRIVSGAQGQMASIAVTEAYGAVESLLAEAAPARA